MIIAGQSGETDESVRWFSFGSNDFGGSGNKVTKKAPDNDTETITVHEDGVLNSKK